MIFDLVRDFTDALHLLPRKHKRYRVLELMQEAIRRDGHFLARHPTTFFQCMWNTCCAGGWPEPGEGEQRASAQLGVLVDSWRAQKGEETPGFVWVRSLRPPPDPLGSSVSAVFRGHEQNVRSLAISPAGDRVVSASDDGTVRVWDVMSGLELVTIRVSEPWVGPGSKGGVWTVAISSDGERIASGGVAGLIEVWDARNGTKVACFPGHRSSVDRVTFCADGQRIASVSQDKSLRLWDIGDGIEIDRCSFNGDAWTAAFSPDGKTLAAHVGSTGEIHIWNVNDGTQVTTLCAQQKSGSRTVFSPTGRYLVSIGRNSDRRLYVFDLARRNRRLYLELGASAWGAAISRNDELLAVALENGLLQVWDLAGGTLIKSHQSLEHSASNLVFSPDGEHIFAGSHGGAVCTWKLGGRESPNRPKPEQNAARVAFSPEGRYLISVGNYTDDTIRIRDPADCTEFSCVHVGDQVRSFTFSNDGECIASGSNSGVIQLWEVPTGRQMARLCGHKNEVSCLAFSPDDLRLVSGSGKDVRDGKEEDYAARVWEAATGAELGRLYGHKSQVSSVSFSNDGRRIVSASRDRTIRVWDAINYSQVGCFHGQEGGFCCATFSPDGSRIASGGSYEDPTVRVWDLSTGDEIACLCGHNGEVASVLYSANGKQIISGVKHWRHITDYVFQEFRVWDVVSHVCLRVIRGRGDSSAIADRQHRCLAVDLETIIESVRTGESLAWFPARLLHLAAQPGRPTWAGSSPEYLYLFTLEGELID